MKDYIISSFIGKYGFLSNFYESHFCFDGIKYQSVEACFQAQKTMDDSIRCKVSKMTPRDAKRYCGVWGHVTLRKNWERVKADIMSQVLEAKFRQNQSLCERLLDTGYVYLLEGNTWHDNEWGDCCCPKCIDVEGKNLLGKALMQLREKMRAERRGFYIPFPDGRRLVVDVARDHTDIQIQLHGEHGPEGIIAQIDICPSGSNAFVVESFSNDSNEPESVVRYEFDVNKGKTTAEENKVFDVTFAMTGGMKLNAASREQALEQFQALSAERLLEHTCPAEVTDVTEEESE